MRKIIELQAYTESLDSDEFSHSELKLSRWGKDLVLKFPYWDLTATVTAEELLKAVEDLVDGVPRLAVTTKKDLVFLSETTNALYAQRLEAELRSAEFVAPNPPDPDPHGV